MRYKTKSVRCLGIDPGIANTGWAVVAKSSHGYTLIADGRIQTPASESTGERKPLTIYKAVSEVVECETPDKIAIERCYHNKNISSSQSTGAVIGVVQLVGAQIGIEVSEFTSQQVKACSGMGGGADKKSVQRMMCKIFKRERLNAHIADTVACAVGGVLTPSRTNARPSESRRINVFSFFF